MWLCICIFASRITKCLRSYTFVPFKDIGEVDLIVNYDSLRSPIRMIQRVGRTGRKRDGRVVCLVSEGAEEKTMRQSKNAEKTLGRALKKSDSFNVVRGSPMFPQAPTLRKLDMASGVKDFHMSQVGGNGLAVKSRRGPSDTGNVRNELNTNWRLNDAQEMHREAMFGGLSFFSTCLELRSSNGQLPQALQKRLLRARTRSISTYENRKKPVPASFGVSRGILLKVERKHGKEVARRVLSNGGLRRSRRESGALQQLLPLERSSETDGLDRSLLKMSLSAVESSPPLQDESKMSAMPASRSPFLAQHKNDSPEKLDNMTAGRDTNMAGARRPQNPYLSQIHESRGRTENSSQIQENVVHRNVAQNVEAPGMFQNVSELPTESDEFRLPTPPASSASEDSDSDDDSVVNNRAAERCIPQPADVAPQSVVADQSSNLCPEIADEGQQHHDLPVPVRLDDTMQEDTFRLPTQDSSSSDEESSDRESDEELSSHAASSGEIFKPPDEINVDHAMIENHNPNRSSRKEDGDLDTMASQDSNGQKPFVLQEDRPSSMEEMETGASQILMDTPDDNSGRSPPTSRLSHDLVSDVAAATPLGAPRSSDDAGAELIDTPQFGETPLAAHCASADSGTDLVDTPQCQDAGQMLPPPARTMSSHDSQCTKDDAQEVVCSICFDGASPEDNPIVLCDGPNNDLSCPISVHRLCYSISGSLDDVDNWHCDVCAFRQQRQSKKRSTIQCFVCHNEDGPLKQMPDSFGQSWFHPHCRYAVVDEDSCCQYCASKGGTRCASEGCTEYAHPHCGLKLSKPWIVVAYASETAHSNLSSDDVIGCNIYCPHHRDQVCRSLVRVGVSASATSVSPRFVIVSSKLRDLNAGTAPTVAAQRKRLRKKSKVDGREDRPEGVAAAKSTDEGIESADKRKQKRQRVFQRMKERTAGMQRCRFLDLEVDMESDEDVEGDHGEEDEARRIEEEERFYSEFINDSSQVKPSKN